LASIIFPELVRRQSPWTDPKPVVGRAAGACFGGSVAWRMGLARQKVNYHFARLEACDLVKVVGERH
jgi:hypothetical protein